MINVIIADDVKILRAGLTAVLSSDSDITVVGEASDGKEAYEMSIKLKPDVVLMDMRMPDYDGGYGTRKIKDTLPDVKVLVLTTFDDKETVDKAIASGADGYILKEMDNEKIINSIKAVAGGINVFCDNVFRSIKKDVIVQQDARNFDLTDREIDFIRLICEGYDNREIASKLFLAEGTVRNGVSRLLEKLGMKDRTQLAVFAIKNNII
ncbi:MULTISPECIES: response regulator [Ruminococcus]|uniref:Stage 0 sporulation protein A homolog n=1 Tax=Ruminococcus flavefaciens TaxID=1265 RepID=A0A1M7H0M3_RUMFL|nr:MULTISPECIES: response regulator transcription factor [Ruminococcus]MCR4794397.1 response regulator transcription factor [Ruminococcus sp.]SHM22060.1 two component transcriptional regulator, LuxR family [Ruminococcus flavefaciens]